MFQRLFDCTVIERSLFGNCLFSGFGVISKTYTSLTIVNVSSDLRESEQVILSAHTRCRHTTYELALLSAIL
jgi:hypothetical protein